MGFFDRLFKGDPLRNLERAEALLEKGEAAEALRLATSAAEAAGPAGETRARDLVDRARTAAVDGYLERAQRAQDEGHFDDAAEWLQGALEHAEDARRPEIDLRLRELASRAEEASRPEAFDPSEVDLVPAEVPEERPAVVGHGVEIDPDDLYETLVGMLDDDVAERYDGRPVEFRQAFVQLGQGDAASASPVLEALAEAQGDDPVLRLERGRCRLMLGQFEGARDDLEAAWTTFGDEPIDLSGNVSLPGLWAETQFALGEHGALVERLRGVADPRRGDPALCQAFGESLVITGQLDEALQFLALAVNFLPGEPTFPLGLAQVLRAKGHLPKAIDVLEGAIAPSCSTGNCSRPPLHPASLRLLIRCHLDALGEGVAGDLVRVRELLSFLTQASGGRLGDGDHDLVAEYEELRAAPAG
ncbi:MAG: tetratricopeptide repeat protein, partial [Acidobacteriota bacterium]